jgi:hypothetical protein
MRILLIALVLTNQVSATELARPPRAQPALSQNWTGIVAQTTATRITLLKETCGWPGGAMRAQLILPNRTIEWGCWGYNETGVQIQWSTGVQTWIDFWDLYFWHDKRPHQLNYKTMQRRLLFLRNNQ